MSGVVVTWRRSSVFRQTVELGEFGQEETLTVDSRRFICALVVCTRLRVRQFGGGFKAIALGEEYFINMIFSGPEGSFAGEV